MTANVGSYRVLSEARGAHWVAWVSRGAEDKPDRGVVLIAKTQEEAVARAETWAKQTSY